MRALVFDQSLSYQPRYREPLEAGGDTLLRVRLALRLVPLGRGGGGVVVLLQLDRVGAGLVPDGLQVQLDRLVLSCIMEIDNRGEIVGYEVCPGIIRSAERMTYTAVNAILQGDESAKARYSALVANFELMRDLQAISYRKR